MSVKHFSDPHSTFNLNYHRISTSLTKSFHWLLHVSFISSSAFCKWCIYPVIIKLNVLCGLFDQDGWVYVATFQWCFQVFVTCFLLVIVYLNFGMDFSDVATVKTILCTMKQVIYITFFFLSIFHSDKLATAAFIIYNLSFVSVYGTTHHTAITSQQTLERNS